MVLLLGSNWRPAITYDLLDFISLCCCWVLYFPFFSVCTLNCPSIMFLNSLLTLLYVNNRDSSVGQCLSARKDRWHDNKIKTDLNKGCTAEYLKHYTSHGSVTLISCLIRSQYSMTMESYSIHTQNRTTNSILRLNTFFKFSDTADVNCCIYY